MTAAERRKFMRFDTSLEGSYEVLSGEVRGRSRIKNLSREGVQVLIDQDLKPGTEVGLYLNVPGDNVPIFACAEVAWNKSEDSKGAGLFTTGAKFSKIDKYDKARLLDYVYAQWLRFMKKEPEGVVGL